MAKEKINFMKMVVPRKNRNTDNRGNEAGREFDTTDSVSLLSAYELSDRTDEQRRKSLTDFALINFAWQNDSYEAENGKLAGASWSRSAYNVYRVKYIYKDGSWYYHLVDYYDLGSAPALALNLQSLISARSASASEIFETKKTKSGREKHFLKIGEYPKTKADDELQQTLEEKFNGGNLQTGLSCTGRLFTTNGQRESGKDFLSKQNPEFEYNGKKYVRAIVWNDNNRKFSDGSVVPKTGAVQWVKVEPVTFEIKNWDRLPKSINPKGKRFGADAEIELETEEAILSGLPFYPDWNHSNRSMWQNSLQRCFLNSAKSEELDGNPEYETPYKWDFSKSGFLYQAFDLTREPTREYVVPECEKKIADYAFAGCVGIEKIVVHNQVKEIGKGSFDGCSFKWAYREKESGNLIFAQSLPEKENEYNESIEIGEISKSFAGFDYGLLLSGVNLDKLKELAKKLDAEKCTLPYAFVKKAQESGKMDELLQANFKAFKRTAKIVEQKNIGVESTADFYVFAHDIGCFSQDQKLRQRANTWLEERISPSFFEGKQKAPDIHLKDFHGQHFDVWQIMPENVEFSEFLFGKNSSEKTFNFDEMKGDKNLAVFLWQIYNEYLDPSQEMKDGGRFRDENGKLMFAVFKESVNEQGQDNSKRKDLKPTVALFKEYFATKKFVGVLTEEDNKISQELLKWNGMTQKHFDRAKNIMQEFHDKQISTSIVGNHLVDISNQVEEYKKQTEALAELGLEAAKEIVGKISDTANKQFTWDWLEKNDPMNFCLGLYCNCCANLAGVGYGIMHSNFVHPDIQNLVVKDAKGNPVAKSTLYVNRRQCYAIFNNVEISHNMSKKQKEEIYYEYMQGVEKFVEEYNNQNPENSLTKVAVGSNLNDLSDQLEEHGHKRGENLQGIEFGQYGISGQRYTGDWMKSDQFLLWKAPKHKGGKNEQKDI